MKIAQRIGLIYYFFKIYIFGFTEYFITDLYLH